MRNRSGASGRAMPGSEDKGKVQNPEADLYYDHYSSAASEPDFFDKFIHYLRLTGESDLLKIVVDSGRRLPDPDYPVKVNGCCNYNTVPEFGECINNIYGICSKSSKDTGWVFYTDKSNT